MVLFSFPIALSNISFQGPFPTISQKRETKQLNIVAEHNERGGRRSPKPEHFVARTRVAEACPHSLNTLFPDRKTKTQIQIRKERGRKPLG